MYLHCWGLECVDRSHNGQVGPGVVTAGKPITPPNRQFTSLWWLQCLGGLLGVLFRFGEVFECLLLMLRYYTTCNNQLILGVHSEVRCICCGISCMYSVLTFAFLPLPFSNFRQASKFALQFYRLLASIIKLHNSTNTTKPPFHTFQDYYYIQPYYSSPFISYANASASNLISTSCRV